MKRGTFLFTVDEYHRMIDNGILTEDDRVELIRGEITPKMGIGDRHATCVRRLIRYFSREFADQAIVDAQNPIVLADSEPEPDLMLLRLAIADQGDVKPRPRDALLVIEVADRSLEMDRDIKMPLYAENGVGEYWIVNFDSDCLEVYRDPASRGYQTTLTPRKGDSVEVAALPGKSILVSELF
jgi:Uma2 family endonuclease